MNQREFPKRLSLGVFLSKRIERQTGNVKFFEEELGFNEFHGSLTALSAYGTFSRPLSDQGGGGKINGQAAYL